MKVRELLKTEVALLRGKVEKVKIVAEEALRRGERNVPSAPEMEELGKDEGVVPEALVPPVLKACPVVVKKIKTQQLKVPQGEEQPLPRSWSTLCSAPTLRLSRWLWDLGVDGIVLSGSEVGKLSSLTVQPTLRQ